MVAVLSALTFLLVLYPRLKPSQLVGTDLVQAVPLVAAASVGHLMYGQVSLGITGSMLIGTMVDELERRGLKRGLITMCAAGGMAPAIIVERMD